MQGDPDMLALRERTGRPTSPNKLGRRRREILLAALTALADAGKPMITNDDVAAIIGGDNDQSAMACLKVMQAHGLIKIQYTPNHLQRRVTIAATGQRTDWQPARPGRKTNPNSRRSRQKAKANGPSSIPLVFQRSAIAAAGYSDSTLYGRDAAAVRALRRAGDSVWKERGVYKVNGRFELDSDALRARAARYSGAAP